MYIEGFSLFAGRPWGSRLQIAATSAPCRVTPCIRATVPISSSIAPQNINRANADEFKVWPSQ
ncbi:MAG: hypothetical protein RR740_03415 [Pseudomonas sp.]